MIKSAVLFNFVPFHFFKLVKTLRVSDFSPCGLQRDFLYIGHSTTQYLQYLGHLLKLSQVCMLACVFVR